MKHDEANEATIRCGRCGRVRTIKRAELDRLASQPALGCVCGGPTSKTPTK